MFLYLALGQHGGAVVKHCCLTTWRSGCKPVFLCLLLVANKSLEGVSVKARTVLSQLENNAMLTSWREANKREKLWSKKAGKTKGTSRKTSREFKNMKRMRDYWGHTFLSVPLLCYNSSAASWPQLNRRTSCTQLQTIALHLIMLAGLLQLTREMKPPARAPTNFHNPLHILQLLSIT